MLLTRRHANPVRPPPPPNTHQAVYILFVQVFVLGWYCGHGALGGCAAAGNTFSYFTVLTYWGMGFYFAAAAAHTFTYARAAAPLLDRFPRPLQALHATLYTTVVVYPFIVTVVYWGLLYPGAWFPLVFRAWSNVSQHAMNSAFALFEILLARTRPPPVVHLLALVVVLALYLALAYLTRATKGFYVYPFLDPSQGAGRTAGYILGILLAVIVVFGLVYGVIALRVWITERKLGMDGKFARQPDTWRAEPWTQQQDTEMAGVRERNREQT